MATKDISRNGLQFMTDISSEDKSIFNGILTGKQEDNQKVLSLMKKFFN